MLTAVIVGSLCSGFILLLVGFLVWGMWREKKLKQYAKDNGDPTVGWIVQANNNLYKKGTADYPAFVLISPDEETAIDEEYMVGLAERLNAMKGEETDDEDEESVSKFLMAETFVPGKRFKVPKSLSEGSKLYIVHIWVFHEHLPDGKLTRPNVMCYVVWDDPKAWVITRPYLTRKGSHRKRDAD